MVSSIPVVTTKVRDAVRGDAARPWYRAVRGLVAAPSSTYQTSHIVSDDTSDTNSRASCRNRKSRKKKKKKKATVASSGRPGIRSRRGVDCWVADGGYRGGIAPHGGGHAWYEETELQNNACPTADRAEANGDHAAMRLPRGGRGGDHCSTRSTGRLLCGKTRRIVRRLSRSLRTPWLARRHGSENIASFYFAIPRHTSPRHFTPDGCSGSTCYGMLSPRPRRFATRSVLAMFDRCRGDEHMRLPSHRGAKWRRENLWSHGSPAEGPQALLERRRDRPSDRR
ncbi:MAG: hypothetical protein KatS3mg111_1199 [Pirellulaceae bacterium]|nr:MAG: hypothetical protein KatS3mg111_1199 [Pirellulaceae bacterium]